MERIKVAVIGTGPTGLCMLKVLRDDGFHVTAFERRSRVAGLWSYSENPTYTTALPITEANISKYPCGFADFPIYEKYPPHMKAEHFQEFMEDYATHFDLNKDIVFDTTVKRVVRNEADTKWLIEVAKKGGTLEQLEFDRVAFCHGYQTQAKIPTYPGWEKFKGTLIHGQSYRSGEQFKDKTVVVVGASASSGDVIPDLIPHARKVYLSHRSGALPIRRWLRGTPADLGITWRRRQIAFFLQRYMPTLYRKLSDAVLKLSSRLVNGRLDPAWRLEPFPSLTLKLTGIWETVVEALRAGTVTSVHGIKAFLGPASVELDDGTVLEDVDAVVCCTGYAADWAVAPFVETSVPQACDYAGSPIYRLYMNIFPPDYADSCTMLCYSAFGKSNGFTFADVSAQAISNVWRGVEPLPSKAAMNRHIDEHQAWVASRWKLEPTIDTSSVKSWEFQGWLHQAAGTGMENIGWGWKGWKFWFKDPELYGLMNNGVETAHAFRYFETGKRKTWSGARDAIIQANKQTKKFPLKNGAVQKAAQGA